MKDKSLAKSNKDAILKAIKLNDVINVEFEVTSFNAQNLHMPQRNVFILMGITSGNGHENMQISTDVDDAISILRTLRAENRCIKFKHEFDKIYAEELTAKC